MVGIITGQDHKSRFYATIINCMESAVHFYDSYTA